MVEMGYNPARCYLLYNGVTILVTIALGKTSAQNCSLLHHRLTSKWRILASERPKSSNLEDRSQMVLKEDVISLTWPNSQVDISLSLKKLGFQGVNCEFQ